MSLIEMTFLGYNTSYNNYSFQGYSGIAEFSFSCSDVTTISNYQVYVTKILGTTATLATISQDNETGDIVINTPEN